MHRLLLACAVAGPLLALGSTFAAACGCYDNGCPTAGHGFGYVFYYRYHSRTGYYQPCYHYGPRYLGYHRRTACNCGSGHGWRRW